MKTRLLIVLGYLGTILVGALVLMLPVSSAAHAWMKPGDALFTACSAVCVTGLSVIDVGVELSRFGQGVLIVLVQLGGLGTMTVGTFFLVLIGRRLSLANEFAVMNAYGAKGVRGWRGLVLWAVLSTSSVELVGMCMLHAVVPGQSWFRCCFYAVMSFCNAGFSLDPGSLAVFQRYPLALLTMGGLLTLGGLGFLVLYNLCTIQFWRRNLVARGRLSFHARVVLLGSLVLVVLALVCVFTAEWNGALEPYSLSEKLGVGIFQAVTPRTCGFTVIPIHELSPVTRFITAVLMFIGAAPGGAGGGIKVTTCAVFVLSILAICRGRDAVTLFRRTVPEPVAREAIVIVTVLALLVVLGMTVLLVSENRGGGEPVPFEALLFETISAVSTAGLSCGTTTEALSPVGRAVIMVCMFCGRLGALAVVFLIGGRETAPSRIRFPKEELVVG